MNIKEYIGKIITVKIDRKMGSGHPKFPKSLYPINYGFIPNTLAADGCEIDVFVLGVFEAIDEFTGKVIAVIHRTNNDDDKVIVVPEGKEYTDDQIRALVEFQEQYFESEIYR